MRLLVVFIFLLMLPITSAKALNTPADKLTLQQIDAKNQQRQLQQNNQREQQLKKNTEVKFQINTPQLKLPEKESPCFPINKISLQDYNLPNQPSQFSHLLQKAFNQLTLTFPYCLGGDGLNVVMKQIQNEIIKQGFVTTRVVASAQDLHSGELVLTVVAGKINNIIIQDSSDIPRFSPLSAWTALALNSDELLNIRDIEQSLENLKRLPTAEANIEIVPAKGSDTDIGASDIKISYAQSFPILLAFGLDDSGSTATGKYQGYATLSFDHFFTANDLFYASFTHSLKSGKDDKGKRGTHNLNLHYSFPIGYWLVSFDLAENKYHQEVFGAFRNYIYSGGTKTEKANIAYTLYRDDRRKTVLSGGIWVNNSNSFIDDEKIDVQHRHTGGWQIGVQHKEYFAHTVLDFSLRYKKGTGAFGATAAPEELFNEGTSRSKLLLANLSLTTPFSLAQNNWQHSLRFNGQWNKTLLTPQERFSIGGRYSVRGFDGELTLSGHKGWTLQNDLSWLIDTNKQLYLGVDYGKVYQQQLDSLGSDLLGAALGLKGNMWGISYDVFFGMPIHYPRGFRTSDTTIGFNINYQF